MAPLAVRVRWNALLGWFVLLLCMELLGYSFANSTAKSYDFRSFYAAGHLVRSSPRHLYGLGHQESVQNTFVSPADAAIPFYHPSYEALLFVPLSFLSYSTAYLVFIAINCLLLGIAVILGPGHSMFPLAKRSRAPAYFIFLPALFTILEGQDSIIFLLICCFVFREMRRGDDTMAGAILALGLFRPQLAVPLALLLACRQGARFLAGFVAMSAPVALVCALIVGRSGMGALYAMLGQASMVQNHGTIMQKAMAVYPQRMPNLYGLLYAIGGRHLTPGASFALTVITSALLFGCCVIVLRKSRSVSTTFGIAVLGTALLSYHLYAYDATILLIPVLLLSGRLHFYLVIVCYVLPYILFFSSVSEWFALYATMPLALLVAAGVRVMRTKGESPPVGKRMRRNVIDEGVLERVPVSVRPS